jgi:hypothetical protein
VAKARKPEKREMTEQKLLALIESREAKSETATVYADQAKALSYYFGDALGNEVEGRSQIVMREVYSTIEWIKPALLRMFFGGEQVVKFTPKGPEDVEQAEQETDVVDHVIVDQNDGFATLYSWFTDAMLSQNAYVLAYWDERTETTESRYRNLTVEELVLIMQDGDIEIVESSSSEIAMADGVQEVWDVTLRRTEPQGKVCIETIPPERIRVEGGYKHVSLQRANFVEYWEDKTISELREAGFDIPDSIADEDDGSFATDGRNVEAVRNRVLTKTSEDGTSDDDDPASREVRVRTVFLRVDFDGDGIAEMRRIVVVGKTVLANDRYDRVLVAALTPTIVPHRHQGLSVADAVMDLQEIKTTLIRGLLDNMYLANNGRHAINEDVVNLDDLLTTRPGGVVRVSGDPHAAIAPLVTPALGAPIIQTIEYMDSVLENRTGASPRVLQGQNFDGNALNKTASGINQVMSAALARIELIARVFAETGVKELYQIVHTLLLKHGQKKLTMQLRGKWAAVDPREWQKRTDMRVNVALGSGDKQARIALLQMIVTAQQGVAGIGLSNPQTMYNSLAKITTEAGYRDPEEFWVNPAKAQPGQQMGPPPDPKVMAEQARLSLDRQKAAEEVRLKELGIRADFQKAQLDADVKRSAAFLQHQVDLAKAAMDRDSREKSDTNARRERLAAQGMTEAGQPAKARRKLVRHHRGQDGRIAMSEVVEVDDDEPQAGDGEQQ